MMAWNARPAWAEAHTRRSNLDLIATVIEKRASAGDCIVVDGAWEGITFDRYYHGSNRWVTIPPVDSHRVHRNDLVFEQIMKGEAMTPVLTEITNALRAGHGVWLVGEASTRVRFPPPWARRSGTVHMPRIGTARFHPFCWAMRCNKRPGNWILTSRYFAWRISRSGGSRSRRISRQPTDYWQIIMRWV